MPVVVITLEGGLIQDTFTDAKNLKVLVANYDVEGASPEELFLDPERTPVHIREFEADFIPAKVNAFQDCRNQTVYECRNCQGIFLINMLEPIKDVLERVAPGEIMPWGERPDCGALVYERR